MALRVSPVTGAEGTSFTFRFVAPALRAAGSGTAGSLSLTVAGPAGTGCVSAHSFALSPAPSGAAVRAVVGPSRLGGPWCLGEWTGRVVELVRAVCPPGEMCPQFIRVLPVAGPVRFRVVG